MSFDYIISNAASECRAELRQHDADYPRLEVNRASFDIFSTLYLYRLRRMLGRHMLVLGLTKIIAWNAICLRRIVVMLLWALIVMWLRRAIASHWYHCTTISGTFSECFRLCQLTMLWWLLCVDRGAILSGIAVHLRLLPLMRARVGALMHHHRSCSSRTWITAWGL